MLLPIIPALVLEATQPKLIYPTRPHIIRPSDRERDPLLAGVGPIAAARRRTSAVIPLSSPLDLAGCSFWYDFQDITKLYQNQAETIPITTTGQEMGGVRDKSGNSRSVGQGTSFARPLWNANGSFHYARFDGFNECLQNGFVNVPVSTVFAVATVRTAGSDASSSMLANLTNTAASVQHVWSRVASTNVWYSTQAAGQALADSAHQWVNRVNTVNWAANAMAVYSVDGTGHPSPVLPTGTNIGLNRNIAGTYLEMDLYEMFAYNSILSAGDRARAEQYLGNRYGITLP